jgi:AcrR family transcriptional regulator
MPAKGPTSPPQELPAVDSQRDGWRTRVLNRSLQQATQRSLERSAQFVTAAHELIEARGSAGFTIQEVADRAGQSLRTFYLHFESKDDVILAVYEEFFEEKMAQARAHVNQYSDPLDRLAAFIIGGNDLPNLEPTAFEVALSHFRFQLLQTNPDGVLAVEEAYEALARQMVHAAADAEELDLRDPDVGAYFITTIKNEYYFGGFILRKRLAPELPSLVELARFCLQGLGAELPSSFS